MGFPSKKNKLYFGKHKYNAVRSKCNLGHSHPSRLEGQYCNQLQMLERTKVIHSFEYAKKYELRVNGELITNHYPDFTVVDNNGIVSIHETKGCETDIWRFKKRLFCAVYPDIPYIVIK